MSRKRRASWAASGDGVAVFGNEVSKSAVAFIQGQSGMSLEKLVDSPKVLIYALSRLFEPQAFW